MGRGDTFLWGEVWGGLGRGLCVELRRGSGVSFSWTPAFIARRGFRVGVERVAGDVVIDGLHD